MKKLIILLCLRGIVFSAIDAQILGIKGGLSFANGKYKLSGTKMETNSLTGLNTGIIGEVPLSESLSLGSGILMIKKGTEREISDNDVKILVRYLEFPVNLVYRFDFVTWRIFTQTGPYAGTGILARIKRGDIKDKVKFGSGADEFKRMDFGINLGGGFEINNIQIGINYGFGLINISNGHNEFLRNRVLSVSAVWFPEDIGWSLRNLSSRSY